MLGSFIKANTGIEYEREFPSPIRLYHTKQNKMPCFSACPKSFQNVENGYDKSKNESKTRAKTAQRSPSLSQLPKYVCPTAQPINEECLDVTTNQIRSKRIAQKQKSRQRTVQVGAKELERLREASKITSLNDRLEEMLKQEAELKHWNNESERIRQHFKEIDDERKKKAEKIALERQSEEVEDKLRVLEKAFLAKHEQEEEVKRVNRIILNAKCHAVRDAQIQEKNKLAKELRQEEIRLERAVNERAQNSLNEKDIEHYRKQAEKIQYAEDIKKQLQERENLRFLEAERIEREAKVMREMQEAVKRAEEKEQQEAKERRLRFREELAKVVEMSMTFKRMMCEQERLADMKIAAYMRDKEERMRQLALEKQIQKEELERKQAHLYNLSQKVLESHSQRDEMNYLRAREHFEREYRKKEKEAAIKKRQIEKDLIEARQRQLQETKHRQALQIARAEQDFNELIERMKKNEDEDRKNELERERRNKCYRMDIIKQMGDKEMERRRLLELERSEASFWRERERQRDSDIRAVIRAKLTAMREACLPEKYIKDVEMQMKRFTNNPRSHLSK